jgi:hypothetical protein
MIIQTFAGRLAVPCMHVIFFRGCDHMLKTNGRTVAYVVVHTAFTFLLIPMLIVMFYFSSKRTRKSAAFIFAVLAVASGLLQGCTMVVTTVRRLHSPVLCTELTSSLIRSKVLCIR